MGGGSVEEIVFMAGSAVILIFSWKSLRQRHSYGYYRFFGLEFVLLTVVSTFRILFVATGTLLEIISWLLMAFALAEMSLAARALLVYGEPAKFFHGTTKLVEAGIYAYVRHPLYQSLVLFQLGLVAKSPSIFGCILLIGGAVSFQTTARAEESHNEVKFGNPYQEYVGRTRMFVPFLY